MKILLADDDAVSRTILRRTLERSGFEVVCVSDGQHAFDALTAEDGPRMAILDWVMPSKDGPTVCRDIRALHRAPSVYLILLTSREDIEDIVAGFNAGADDYLTKPCNPEELKARIQVGKRSLQLQDSLIHEAQHDSLTGLPNRAFFVKRLAENTRKARELPGYEFTLLFVDIDRFKFINDSLGHLIGDELMQAVAARLLQSVRAEALSGKTAVNDLVARIGGDEFVILLEDFAGINDGIRVAERIQAELLPAFHLGGNEVIITASIGISTSGGNATDSSEVLRGADAAMYRAKQLGKARYEINSSHSNSAAIDLLRLEGDLRRAVLHEEFVVHYQPIVHLSDTRIVGFEALVRWHHPSRGLLQPGAFIEVAEDTGLIVPIGVQVMRDACRQIQDWNTQFNLADRLTICVNVSPRQFVQDDLVHEVTGVLSTTGLDPNCLDLEITENLTMQDANRAEVLLTALSQTGVSISLDDFGTGYSSLSYLLRFPISTLKIDRSFIANIEHNRKSAAVVQTIIALGHNLGMTVVAEGIETAAQMEILRSLNCDHGQGFFFSRPIEAAHATAMLATSAAPIAKPRHPNRPHLLKAS